MSLQSYTSTPLHLITIKNEQNQNTLKYLTKNLKNFNLQETIITKQIEAKNIILNTKEITNFILIDNYNQEFFLCLSKIPKLIVTPCNNEFSASMAKEHNNSNILILSTSICGLDLNLQIVKNFLTSNFLEGKHKERIATICNYKG
jgi:ribose 5-phosphate isomerase RpiB